jgi:hypothetical protein
VQFVRINDLDDIELALILGYFLVDVLKEISRPCFDVTISVGP